MPSQLAKWCRSDPYDARVANFRKARSEGRWHSPRPWRSKDESLMIRRYGLQWWTCCDSNKPSGRSWARQLGISHVWLLKLVRQFKKDPAEVQRLQAYGDPTFAELSRAREESREMREQGDLRPLRYKRRPSRPRGRRRVR